ncbi:elongation factor Ts [Gracilaria domingensis]|nr:elongation factor Ts [Gracilaria domingensis]
MIRKEATVLLTLALIQTVIASGATASCKRAVYKITFRNLLTPAQFGKVIPDGGLVFSPMTGASHSNRISLLTVRGFASPQVEQIAETGDNGRLVKLAEHLRDAKKGVKTVVAANGPTLPGNRTTLRFEVDCKHPFITFVGMIAPSPDWLVLIANRNLYENGGFVRSVWGKLIAYDAGTDDGGDFTDPVDASLDMPTEPPMNIAPLEEDETDPFNGRTVGSFYIKRLR